MDPDSGLMRKSKRHEYRQSYNAQSVATLTGVIVGRATGESMPSDANELVADIESIPAGAGSPGRTLTVVADNGFACRLKSS